MKDELVEQTVNHKDPYKAKASDFPVKSVSPANGQGGGKGSAEGKDSLVKQGESLAGPRHLEDGGSLTPSVWGKGGKAFGVGKNDAGAGSSVSIAEGLDLETGQVTCKSHKKTPVGEVPEDKLSIG